MMSVNENMMGSVAQSYWRIILTKNYSGVSNVYEHAAFIFTLYLVCS